MLLQVDWYCCNVGPYHAMRAMDRSVGVADDEDVKRWVVDEDAVVAGAVAKAVGPDGLDALVEHFTSEGEPLSAAKLQWAIACDGALVDEERMKAALALVDGLATKEAQQLVSVPVCCPVSTAFAHAYPQTCNRSSTYRHYRPALEGCQLPRGRPRHHA